MFDNNSVRLTLFTYYAFYTIQKLKLLTRLTNKIYEVSKLGGEELVDKNETSISIFGVFKINTAIFLCPMATIFQFIIVCIDLISPTDQLGD